MTSPVRVPDGTTWAVKRLGARGMALACLQASGGVRLANLLSTFISPRVAPGLESGTCAFNGTALHAPNHSVANRLVTTSCFLMQDLLYPVDLTTCRPRQMENVVLSRR